MSAREKEVTDRDILDGCTTSDYIPYAPYDERSAG